MSATGEGEQADQLGLALGAQAPTCGVQGQSTQAQPISIDPNHWIRDGTVVMGCTWFYSSVTGVVPSAAAKSPEMGQTQSPGV
jgi:hypothetical protein